ncbi:unnamed protein product, partial [Symbiodinium sp. KB8]
ANLAEMAKLGLPVPPGFTVRAEASELKGKLTDAMRKEIEEAIAHVEKGMGRKFGATSKEASALLLSVRSGAAISMPGMME